MSILRRKKVVMIGAFGVGKTSLVRRFVSNEFSADYQSTIGVQIEKRTVLVDGYEVELHLWDLAGEDEFAFIRASHLKGASGTIFVADRTRAVTVSKALEIYSRFPKQFGELPMCMLINKSDLDSAVDLDEQLSTIPEDWMVMSTSAKTGEHVVSAFEWLAKKMVA